MKPLRPDEITPCACCGERLGQSPLFYRVTVEQHALDMNAVRRRMGEEAMMGALAGVLGTVTHISVPFAEGSVLVCLDCLVNNPAMCLALEAAGTGDTP